MNKAKSTESVMQRCRRVKRRAQAIITHSEHQSVGIRRPAARRAWRMATDIQNAIHTL